MTLPYEGQPLSDKSSIQKKISIPLFEYDGSSQSIPSVRLSEALEKILQAPSILHAKEPIRDPYLMNDVFLLMFISMMVVCISYSILDYISHVTNICFILGIIIAVTISTILAMQYTNMMLTEEIIYLLAASCLIISGILVLFSACTIAHCTDCKPRSKMLVHIRTALKLVLVTIILLIGTIGCSVKSRLNIKFEQTTEVSTFTQPTSVMGEPIIFENNTIIKIYPKVMHKLYLNPFSVYSSKVKVVLSRAMLLYNSSKELMNYWDLAQKQLSCCGLEDSSDWIAFLPNIPESCCVIDITNQSSCPHFYSGGCLIRLAYMQAWYSSMMAGAGAIALVVMIGVVLLLLFMYKLEKGKLKICSSSVSLKSQNNKILNCSSSHVLSQLDTRSKCEPVLKKCK